MTAADALVSRVAEVLGGVRRNAQGHAVTARAQGHERERDWLDLLHLLDMAERDLAELIASERAAAAVEALESARDDIRDRRREFNRLHADNEYLLALDDAYGLVNNRAATYRSTNGGA